MLLRCWLCALQSRLGRRFRNFTLGGLSRNEVKLTIYATTSLIRATTHHTVWLNLIQALFRKRRTRRRKYDTSDVNPAISTSDNEAFVDEV